MEKAAIQAVFESLTAKQDEAIRLASQHLTSKQIAQELGVAPVTIDKRIDAVRAKLGQMSRVDVLRQYRAWAEQYDRTIDDPIILTDYPSVDAPKASQPAGRNYVFEDSLAFDARTTWDRPSGWLRPGISPSDLGAGGKLLFIVVGAVALMCLAVLLMAFANGLASML